MSQRCSLFTETKIINNINNLEDSSGYQGYYLEGIYTDK